VLGANVGNHNSEVIGIENEGLYTDVDVTPELWDSLVALVAYIAGQYGTPVENIVGHRDFNATECPGDVLYGRLPELRTAVGGVLNQPVRQPLSWPLLKPGSTGEKVLAAQHLLRARGMNVAADGVFGPATFAAARQFAAAHGVAYEACFASRVADESGFIGSTTWPLLVRTVRANESTEDAKAARVLLSGSSASRDTLVDLPTWRRLLS
jgi:peptidoglycan hydrolase-like protein with peptidoglycan-binding domain